MNIHSFSSRPCHPLLLQYAAVTLAALVALLCTSGCVSSSLNSRESLVPIAGGGEILDAAKSGDLERVKALLKQNPALILSRDNNGATPLHMAALNGNKDIVELLLAYKADANAKNNIGVVPLHMAADRGYTDVASLLLAHGADVNAKMQYGMTPLHMAAGTGRKDMAALLLANNAEVNARAINGNTPLHLAVANGHEEVAELLRQHGGTE